MNQFDCECVITKGLDNCLWMFFRESWNEFANQVSQLSVFSKNCRQVQLYFFSNAVECVLKNGIFKIPASLKSFFKESDLIVVCLGNRFEIWNKSDYKDLSCDDIDISNLRIKL